MRRILALITSFALAVCLAGCGDTVPATWNTGTAPSSQTTSASESESESESETTAVATSETTSGNDTLVAYFSATGTTKGIAEKIAKITDADLYEITAAQPYTDDDRNWKDSKSRCSIEQNDASVRPEISSETISLEGYKTIYIGYPIWFAQEPRIMDTFVEKYNFEGITVIPFCTSGSSGIGQSGKNLEANAGSGKWLEGKRFSGSATEEEIKEWIESMRGEMVLMINGAEVPVTWEDNDSVKALAKIAAGGLTIKMSPYGGFEQVGPIGQAITKADKQITTSPGDIVLYSGDQIVVFYGSNTWSYTKLGKINLSEKEITDLLSKDAVEISITVK
jgi:flavodoxin